MNFLIAPNALKGSLSAIDAAEVIARAIHEILPDAKCRLSPIADGGDGTLDCLVQATGGEYVSSRTHGPLPSMEVTARWGILGDKTTAVIETAEAAGLRLLRPSEYNVMSGTTFGVGELIEQAARHGCSKILVGLGGSATNDGGMGCCRALSAKFFDRNGSELEEGGKNLQLLHRIEFTKERSVIKQATIVGLSDVTNVLCGPAGAAFTFAPQKGATPEEVRRLDDNLRHYASIIERDMHRQVSDVPGSGAAGGLGAGLIAFCDATIESGINFVLDLVGFDERVKQCDCIITAEGKIDAQTLNGKGIDGVARRAKKWNKPVHAFAGRIGGDRIILQSQLGLSSLVEISPEAIEIEEAMKNAGVLLSNKIKERFPTLKL